MTKKSTRRALLASVMSMLLCFTMLLGTTYAWFTDSVVSSGNKIVAGTLDVDLLMADASGKYDSIAGVDEAIFSDDIIWEPGKTQIVYLGIENKGNLDLKYNIALDVVNGGLIGSLEYAIIDGAQYGNLDTYTDWAALKADAQYGDVVAGTIVAAPNGAIKADEDIEYFALAVHMKEEADNKYQGKHITIDVTVLATQLASEEDSFNNQYDKDATYPKLAIADTWDGTADTSWYNDTDTEFTLSTAEALAGLAKLVDDGNNFKGKTITLASDMNLYFLPDGTTEPKSFDPIGDDVAFEGTFDGQGHAIENLYQSGWAFGYEWGSYGSVGLFGELKDATIKNLTISGAESFVEGGDVGGITGSATGSCVFENITIQDSDFGTYNNGNGGIIGWSGAGNYTFKNITIAEDVTLAGLWGSFDSSIGGVVGQGEPGATYNFENVDIACRLDVYNDCTASYDYYNYRMCGMLIGRLQETTTIDGINYPDTSKYNITCTNVTVTYGGWANYHYCEPTPGLNGGRGMRVEPGYAYDGLPADFDHSQCTTNHMALIPFDQIFGGDQLGVKGLASYNGVTVTYNNK